MAMFRKKEDTSKQDLTTEVGVDGSVVFESFDKEEARTDTISIAQYRKMIDTDTTVEALVNIFTMGVLSSSYSIEADANDIDEVQAEFIRKNLLEPPHKGGMQLPMDLFLEQAMQAVYDGFALFEKVYTVSDGKLVIKRLAKRNAATITLIRDDEDGFGGARQRAARADGSSIDVIIPPQKLLLVTYGKSRDFLYGRSALRSLYPRYEKKRKLEYLDSIALQADAIKPKILKRTTDGVSGIAAKKAMRRALDMLSRLGERKPVGAIPYGYDVEVLNTEGRDPHQSIERQNSEMARAFHASVILTATQGSASNVGSYSLSNNQKDLLHTAMSSVMKLLAEHINQYLIADLIDLNFAERHYPEFKFNTPDSSVVSAVFEAFKIMAQKDKVSDEMVEGIEKQTAERLGVDLEAIKRRREEDSASNNTDGLDGGDGGNADKFLDDLRKEVAVNSQGGTSDAPFSPIREMTEAEQSVKFESMARWIDDNETNFEYEASKALNEATTGVSLADDFALPASYRQLLVKYYRGAYNYGKLAAADEQKLPAPALKSELKQRETEFADFIINKQTEDVRTIIASEKLKRPLELADDAEERDNELISVLGLLLTAWVVQAVRGTKGTIISQGLNDGRNDSFAFFDKTDDGALYQWSSVMEKNTCGVCSALDGNIITAEEKATTVHNPQKHFNCKCIWVRIPSSSPDHGKIKASGINSDLVERLDFIQRSRKADLSQSIPGATLYTKSELQAIEAYKGNAYIGINQSLLNGSQNNEYIQGYIKHLDKAIKKSTLSDNVVLYRGIGLKKDLVIGDIINGTNFTSTSTNIDVATDFAEKADHKKYLLTVRAPKGMPYLDVDGVLVDVGVNSNLREYEYLMSRGKKFVVKKVQKMDNGITMADVEITDDTKYLSDDNGLTVGWPTSDELLAKANESAKRLAKRREDPNYKPSQTSERLHHIWQMESDHYSKHPEAIYHKEDQQ